MVDILARSKTKENVLRKVGQIWIKEEESGKNIWNNKILQIAGDRWAETGRGIRFERSGENEDQIVGQETTNATHYLTGVEIEEVVVENQIVP